MFDIHLEYFVALLIIMAGLPSIGFYYYNNQLKNEKRTIEDLKEKNKAFKHKLSLFDELIWSRDVTEDRWWFNDKIYSTFGYEKLTPHLTFEDLYNLIHIKDGQKMFEILKKGIMPNKFNITIRVLNAKKYYQWVHIIGVRVIDEKDKNEYNFFN